MMRSRFTRFISAVSLSLPIYTVSASVTQADEWGCEVLLCISNPGGATEFPECRPPIERLWSHLAKGRAFPTCSGLGVSTAKPRYEPYYCNEGFRLVKRAERRLEVGCVSTERQEVSAHQCRNRMEVGWESSYGPVRWERQNGMLVCKAHVTTAPNIRAQPRYIDVTIDGSSRQRVWF